jgi:flagellar basal-body rod protein FlgB
MPIADIPLFSMLRTRMQWHQERQRLLAENVANAETPRFQPRDLAPANAARPTPAALDLVRTSPVHLASSADTARFQLTRRNGFEIVPTGNAVNLEDQMLKVADNQMDFQTVTTLYSRGLGLIKTALGKK